MSQLTSSKICFNPECVELKSEPPRKGWRLRCGDFSELCDGCGSAYQEGRYCDIFHMAATGWRCCESCGKRVHCGCVVSSHALTLLDAGGINCISCARKNAVLQVSGHAWSPSLFHQAPLPERFKDISLKNWNHLTGSGPMPWWQAPSLLNPSISQPELHPKVSYETDRISAGDRLSTSSLEKRKADDSSERYKTGSLNFAAQDVAENEKGGINCDEHPSSCMTLSHPSSSVREELSTPQHGIHLPSSSPKETNGSIGVSGNSQPLTSPSLPKQLQGNLDNGVDSAGEIMNRNGKPRPDGRGRSQLLSRYWPRFTDQELQQISENTNSVITPLFEKMLSASDAGRIGRLVLPKKCAEAYFPQIYQPEGLPLKVQDSKGKEWIFQFRFWPNNNSRMYVLEGVTPCIQSMQLQAGDTVTFSRLEPEGKLLMGFRKASTPTSADQDSETGKPVNGIPMHGDAEFADPSSLSKADKSGYIAKEVLGSKSSVPRKRKTSVLGPRKKRLRIENDDLLELKLNWEEAQGLLRPPLDHSPNVSVIEGFEFEEYENAPIMGRPTIFATDDAGEKVQWVQCEDCFKWRMLLANAILPSRWTCSDNKSDPERSACSAAQALTSEQLEDLVPPFNSDWTAASKETKAASQEPCSIESVDGLDTLANLALLGDSDSEALPESSQATTKHPRHRPGCSCIVCIQPPSGKGLKHKQTCTCNVCQTAKRRFRTLMVRRERKQSEKEAESLRKQQEDAKILQGRVLPCSNSNGNDGDNDKVVTDGGASDHSDRNKTKSSASVVKGRVDQFDLNIQPEEREEESSPSSDSGSMMRLLQDATERYLKQRQRPSCDKPRVDGEVRGEKVNSGMVGVSSGHRDIGKEDSSEHFSMKKVDSSSTQAIV